MHEFVMRVLWLAGCRKESATRRPQTRIADAPLRNEPPHIVCTSGTGKLIPPRHVDLAQAVPVGGLFNIISGGVFGFRGFETNIILGLGRNLVGQTPIYPRWNAIANSPVYI